MKKWILLLLALGSVGCVGHLRQDSAPPAVDSEYPTLEFHLKDKIYHGLGIVSVVDGSDLSALGLSVQGYYTGTLRIDSTDCNLGLSAEYTNFELVPVPLQGSAHKTCVISVVMNPTYAPQSNDPIQVYGFKGYFVIRVIRAGDSWTGSTHKVTGSFTDPLKLNVGGTGSVRTVFTGCGINFDENLPLDDQGFLTVGLDRLVAKNSRSTCVLDGVVISPVFQDLMVNAVVSQYDPAFTPLPIPAVSVIANTITVTGDDAVSVVGIDLNHKFSSAASFKHVDLRSSHLIRVFTVKGRSVICNWNQEPSCLQ